MHRIDPTFRDAWERIKVRRAKAKRYLAEAEATLVDVSSGVRQSARESREMWYGIDQGLMQAMDAMLEVEPTLYWDKMLPEVEPIPDPPPATWVTPVPLPKPVTRTELKARLDAAAEEGVNELLDAIAPVEPTFYDNVKVLVEGAGIEMPTPPTDDQIWGMALMEGRAT